MERSRIPLSLGAALAKAQQAISHSDPAVLAAKSLTEFEPRGAGGRIVVPYYGEEYAVSVPEGLVSRPAADASPADDVPVVTQVLLLHYLLNASGQTLVGRWVSYRELPQGNTYERAFHQRAIAPLEVAFGHDLEGFLRVSSAAGGERARLGDASFFFRVLPRVPLICVLWLGDEEVPGGANMLFDAAAGAYLPGEDLAYLGIALTARLLGAKGGALLT